MKRIGDGPKRIGIISKAILLILGFILVIGVGAAFSQVAISREGQFLKKGTVFLQCETASSGNVFINQATFQKETLYLFEFGPKVGVFIGNQLSVSADGYWGTVYGTLIDDFKYWGYGGNIKYYPFAKIRSALMDGAPWRVMGTERLKKERDRRFVCKNLFPFISIDFRHMEIPNIHNSSSAIQIGPTRENALRMNVGVVLRIFKGLSLEAGLGAEYWNDGLGFRFGGPLSINYYFPIAKHEKGY